MLHPGFPMLALVLVVPSCAPEASHVPNPLLLPGQAITTGVENAVYNTRRSGVDTYVRAHHPALIGEMGQGGGPHLDRAMDLALVPAARRPTLQERLRADGPLYRSDPEALVVALMVHGG